MPSSMARMKTSSSISSAAGMMPAAMIAETASEASSMVEKDARSVFTASGRWVRRTITAGHQAERALGAHHDAR